MSDSDMDNFELVDFKSQLSKIDEEIYRYELSVIKINTELEHYQKIYNFIKNKAKVVQLKSFSETQNKIKNLRSLLVIVEKEKELEIRKRKIVATAIDLLNKKTKETLSGKRVIYHDFRKLQ